ncbi:MAG: hypothetical protein B2I17_05335 [Thermoplasmatales archaeon B_DKE]|nr:MAG: hypothetical protein B2I17_05335 [Thermoplasmatales archaeon B_DKE]
MIGLINFSHTEPLAMAMDNRTYIREHPRDLLAHVLDGNLECAMVSLVSYLENRDRLAIMETANIHSRRGTLSTLLVSKGKGIEKDMNIAITAHTRTTSFYLERILSAMGITHRSITRQGTLAADLLSDSDYALVIGDEALEVFNGGYRILMDIGYEFSRIFSMPPLYAVTVYRKDQAYPREDHDLLQDGVAQSHLFRAKAVEKMSTTLHIPRSVMDSYYRCIEYDFNPLVRGTADFVQRELVS